MRKTLAFIVSSIIAAVAICTLANGQSSPKRRTPVLTSEDLGVAGREVVTVPAASEARTARRRSRCHSMEPRDSSGCRLLAGKAARSESKLLIVDVYTDWCGWCKKMDNTIYSDPIIVALSRKEVFVKLNAEDRAEGQRFAEEVGVSGYPTTIILDEQGRVLNMAEGYIASPQAFVQFVEQARMARAR